MEPLESPEDDVACHVPQAWDQVGIFRYVRLLGALGGIEHTWVQMPGAQSPVRREQERNWPGLFEEQVDIDGFWTVRTAKGLLLEKTCMIPVPEQRREPEDPRGDGEEVCDWGREPY